MVCRKYSNKIKKVAAYVKNISIFVDTFIMVFDLK